jgi:hypothetical protein
MLYFNSFPKVLTTDYNNNALILTNILRRVEIIPSLLNNPLLFYSYDIQEEDTPEIVANKYYGDSYRYWMVLLCNQIIDPQWGWPLTTQQLDLYLVNKYRTAASSNNVLSYIQSTVQEYNKTITTTDSVTLNTTSTTIVVDYPTYLLTETGTISQSFGGANGSISQTTTKSIVSIYEYEIKQNEAKRNINLIDKKYADDFEKQLSNLLGS